MKDEENESKVGFHPSSFRLHPFIHPSSFQINSVEQRINARCLLFNSVADEVKRGSMPQIQRKAKLLAHVRRRMLQSPQGLVVFRFVSFNRDIDTGIAQVVRHADISDGHRHQSWIFEFVTHDLRNLFTQGVSDALWPVHNSKDEG